jgi:hypothetical protein
MLFLELQSFTNHGLCVLHVYVFKYQQGMSELNSRNTWFIRLSALGPIFFTSCTEVLHLQGLVFYGIYHARDIYIFIYTLFIENDHLTQLFL